MSVHCALGKIHIIDMTGCQEVSDVNALGLNDEELLTESSDNGGRGQYHYFGLSVGESRTE